MPVKSFEEVLERFRSVAIDDEFDMVVAIANGGIVPAAIINQRLGLEMNLLHINLRDEHQKPKYDRPRLVAPVAFSCAGKRILLVDDRIKSGSTIELAREIMSDAAMIKTLAVNGNADYALYNEECFRFPWII